MAHSLTTRPCVLTWPRERRGTEVAEAEAEGGEAEAAGASMTGDTAVEDSTIGEEVVVVEDMTTGEAAVAADITMTEVG